MTIMVAVLSILWIFVDLLSTWVVHKVCFHHLVLLWDRIVMLREIPTQVTLTMVPTKALILHIRTSILHHQPTKISQHNKPHIRIWVLVVLSATDARICDFCTIDRPFHSLTAIDVNRVPADGFRGNLRFCIVKCVLARGIILF